jgi:hypothetical protein
LAAADAAAAAEVVDFVDYKQQFTEENGNVLLTQKLGD